MNELTMSPDQPYNNLTSYAIKLIRRLLIIADDDYSNITLADREWLEAVLQGTSVSEIARHTKLSPERIRQRVTAALDQLNQKIDIWEETVNNIPAQNYRVKLLEAEVRMLNIQLEDSRNQVSLLEEETKSLKNILDSYTCHQKMETAEKEPVDENMKAILGSSVQTLGLPMALYRKLTFHKINTILDLVRYSYEQLILLRGISVRDADLISSKLEPKGLRLGADVR